MLIYNVTTKVDWSIADDWVQWMKDIYIPGILATGCFNKYQFVRLLDVDDVEGPTYAVQYFSPAKSRYDYYTRKFAATFRNDSIERWGEKFISFGSIMEIVK